MSWEMFLKRRCSPRDAMPAAVLVGIAAFITWAAGLKKEQS